MSKSGYVKLDAVMGQCARLYNAALEEWQTAWRRGKHSVGLYDQIKQFTGVRQDDPFWAAQDVGIGRGVLQRLERAKNAFYRRVKAGQTPGYPRFKSGRRWKTIDLAEVRPSMVKGKFVRIKGLPPIEIKGGGLPDSTALKSLRITRAGRRVTVSLAYAVEREPLPATSAAVGIDMGITDRMVLSSGEMILAGVDIPAAVLETAEIPAQGVSPGVGESSWRRPKSSVSPGAGSPLDPLAGQGDRRVSRAASIDVDIQRKQRRLSRTRKGSCRFRERARILANAHSRARVSRRNAAHRITTDIVRRYGLLGVEKLQIANMTRSAKGTAEAPGRNVAAKSGLNREILAQGWGLLRQQLAYKAAWAGRQFVEVDPKYTSQTCNVCGSVNAESRQGKEFRCVVCGHQADADVNAARNILSKAVKLARGNEPAPGPYRAAVLETA